jgi:hypothetical protein
MAKVPSIMLHHNRTGPGSNPCALHFEPKAGTVHAHMPKKGQLILDLAMFAFTVLLALQQKWATVDLVWSLWISSLLLGYSFLLVSIIGTLFQSPTAASGPGLKSNLASGAGSGCQSAIPLLFLAVASIFIMGFSRYTLYVLLILLPFILLAAGGLMRRRPGWEWLPDPDKGLARAVIMLPFALFMLGFFTVHFGGFHFVHSIFLNGFFPIHPDSPFGKNMEETFGLFPLLIREAFTRYWPFVLAGGLARVPDYIGAFRAHSDAMMFKPYLNVVKMHVMIFVFAFLGSRGASGWGLYILLALYFFPFGELMKNPFRKSSPPPPTPTP